MVVIFSVYNDMSRNPHPSATLATLMKLRSLSQISHVIENPAYCLRQTETPGKPAHLYSKLAAFAISIALDKALFFFSTKNLEYISYFSTKNDVRAY